MEGADPGQSWANDYKVVTKLNEAGAARVAQSDANHFLYLARANQLFVAGQPKDSLYKGLLDINVPVMLIYTDEDLIFPKRSARDRNDYQSRWYAGRIRRTRRYARAHGWLIEHCSGGRANSSIP